MTDIKSTPSPLIHDSYTSEFKDNADGTAIIRAQEIPQAFLDDLKDRRVNADHTPEGNFMLAASIPVIVHEQWLKEGYDCTREDVRSTLKRLRERGLDAFIATNKRI